MPGESHGWNSLVGYSPWGHKESDMTEQAHLKKVLPFPGYLPNLRIKSISPTLTGRVFTTEPPGKGIYCLCAKSLQSCSALCDPVDCSPPGSSVHGILQTRTLEQVAISRRLHCQAVSLPLRHLGSQPCLRQIPTPHPLFPAPCPSFWEPEFYFLRL